MFGSKGQLWYKKKKKKIVWKVFIKKLLRIHFHANYLLTEFVPQYTPKTLRTRQQIVMALWKQI